MAKQLGSWWTLREGESACEPAPAAWDAELLRRYVLTNRHIAGPGPFSGSCIFYSQEEVECYPLYVDPVHDFAFLKYDPTMVRYMSLDGLSLCSIEAAGGSCNFSRCCLIVHDVC